MAAADPAALALALRGAAQSDLPPRDQVAAITVPALILAWDDDPGYPRSTAEALHELLGASELEVATSQEEVAAWPSRLERFLAEIVAP